MMYLLRKQILIELKALLNFKNSAMEIDTVILSVELSLVIQEPHYVMNVYQESLELEMNTKFQIICFTSQSIAS